MDNDFMGYTTHYLSDEAEVRADQLEIIGEDVEEILYGQPMLVVHNSHLGKSDLHGHE